MTEPRGERIETLDRGPVVADEYYECTYCHATFEEWTEACPACDQLVVRVVAR